MATTFAETPEVVPTLTELTLYTDGSFCHELGLGAWAFRVPSLRLEEFGIQAGSSSLYFELLAILRGLEAIARCNTALPISVFSDCRISVELLNNRKRKGENAVAGTKQIWAQLQSLLTTRQVTARKCCQGCMDHLLCHRNANRALHAHIQSDPMLAARFTLIRQRSMLRTALAERTKLEQQIEKLEDKIFLGRIEENRLAAQLADLENSSRAVGQHKADDRDAMARVPVLDSGTAI